MVVGAFPQFTVNRIDRGNGSLVLIGVLDRTNQDAENWVADGWMGALFKDKAVTFGR